MLLWVDRERKKYIIWGGVKGGRGGFYKKGARVGGGVGAHAAQKHAAIAAAAAAAAGEIRIIAFNSQNIS